MELDGVKKYLLSLITTPSLSPEDIIEIVRCLESVEKVEAIVRNKVTGIGTG